MPDVDLQLPFEAYAGNQPYLFVSYAHKDGGSVFPELRSLHQAGYRIWYDEGIDPGNEWPDEIAKALDRAEFFMVFISKSAVDSRNVRNEINYALNKQKPFLAVYLEDIALPPGLELRMGDIQAIMRWRMTSDHYIRKVAKALPTSLRDDSACVAEAVVTSGAMGDFEVKWAVSLRGTQFSPIRRILPVGREILCLSRSSPETWIYAVHAETGKLLWHVGAAQDGRVKLHALALTQDYLYLTGEVEVEESLRFARKVWLREGDMLTSVSWYETSNNKMEKYKHFPEWDSLHWQDIDTLESQGLDAYDDTYLAEIHSSALTLKRRGTTKVLRWSPPEGHISAMAMDKPHDVVVAFYGRVCRISPRAMNPGDRDRDAPCGAPLPHH